VSLRVEGGAVSADLRVQTPAAQHWIASNEGDLRSALERQGLHLDRMQVSHEPGPDRRSDRQPRPAVQPPPPRRRADKTAPEFTVAG